MVGKSINVSPEQIVAEAGGQLSGVIENTQRFLESRPDDNGRSVQALSAAALTINDMIQTQTARLTEHNRRPLEVAAEVLRTAIAEVNLPLHPTAKYYQQLILI